MLRDKPVRIIELNVTFYRFLLSPNCWWFIGLWFGNRNARRKSRIHFLQWNLEWKLDSFSAANYWVKSPGIILQPVDEVVMSALPFAHDYI